MAVKPEIWVSSVKPAGYSHAGAFDEVYETVAYGLESLGFSVSRVENLLSQDIPAILFGGHLLNEAMLEQLPPTTILYNLEQADPHAAWLQGPFPRAMQRHEVWDFSETNVRRLSAAGVAPKILWAPVGYVPQMTRIAPAPEDIDVLFYGSLNVRRGAVLDQLRARNLNVVHAFGVYGEERDRLIARAKVILNMHYYESGIFEWVRVFYLLANFRTVVSEESVLGAFDNGVENVVRFAAYDHLVDVCETLVHDDQSRRQLVAASGPYLQRRQEDVILRSVLGSSSLGALVHP